MPTNKCGRSDRNRRSLFYNHQKIFSDLSSLVMASYVTYNERKSTWLRHCSCPQKAQRECNREEEQPVKPNWGTFCKIPGLDSSHQVMEDRRKARGRGVPSHSRPLMKKMGAGHLGETHDCWLGSGLKCSWKWLSWDRKGKLELNGILEKSTESMLSNPEWISFSLLRRMAPLVRKYADRCRGEVLQYP